MRACLLCRKTLLAYQKKFCSNKCQADLQYKNYIERWLDGKEKGDRGRNTKNFSNHVIRYMKEIHGQRCQLCNWAEVHPVTNTSPLEIDHIDGNSENNKLHNLRLLCPNCHALSINYRNHNKGNGRLWRRKKYGKISIVPL